MKAEDDENEVEEDVEQQVEDLEIEELQVEKFEPLYQQVKKVTFTKNNFQFYFRYP